MDQSLKARLIGATVLVVLAVLLIPELLSGHKSATSSVQETPASDRRTVTIDIAKSGGTATAPSMPSPQPSTTEAPPPAEPEAGPEPAKEDGAAADRAAGAPQAGTAESPEPKATPQQGAAKAPTASIAPSPSAASASAPSTGAAGRGGYFVQVGAFSSAESARKLVAQLVADGYSAQVSPIARGGKTLHRVRVGPVASRADGQQLAARLKARGLPVALVTSE